ncbi:MAG: hypothetical protein ACOH18_04305 [Candidatus Saccharimonadaceae bacterium]
MIFNRKRFSILLVFAVLFSFLSPLGTELASAYTYRDPSITTEDACKAAGGVFTTAYNGSTLESHCDIQSSASQESAIILNAAWLADCTQYELTADTNFDEGQLSEGKFDYGGKRVIGHVIARDNGQKECNNANDVASALKAVGYSSLIALLYDIGCSDSDKSISCSASKVTSLSASDLYAKFSKRQYNTVTLDGVNKYYIALNTFKIGCKASEITNPTDADNFSFKNGSDKLYKIKVLSDDGLSLREALYKIGLSGGDQISTINGSAGWDDGTFQCKTLASMVNSNSNDYLYFARNHIAQIAVDNSANNSSDPDTADSTSTCVVDGVGWIVCPILNFMSNITDAIYGLISGWLTIHVSLFDVNSGTYKGWAAIRNLANIGFAIVFLIVIFSQLTGAGISNYGVKKVLPRLIVMAIAINASFYITQFMVDVSNVVGSSVGSFFSSAAVFDSTNGGFGANGNTFTDVVGNLLAGQAVVGIAAVGTVGVIAYGGVGLFIMVILAAIVAVAVTLLILAARQAFIVILIVVSPLAFLAMIFPNTKKWYDNWQKIFISLLVIYPMIALVFAASALAAKILITENAILGLAVATIPLFAVIPMIKGSLKAVPIAGNLASKFAGKASLGGKVKSGAKQARGNAMGDIRSRALGSNSKTAQWLAGGQARGVARNRRFGADAARAEALYTAHNALKEGSSATISERAAAQSALHEIDEKEIANIITLDSANGGVAPDKLLARLSSAKASKAEKIAAVRQIEARGGMSTRLEMARLTSSAALGGDINTPEGADNAEVRQSIVGSTAKMGEASPSYGGGSLKAMQAGTFDAAQAHVDLAKSNVFNARSFLGMHPVARDEFLDALKNSSDPQAKAALKAVQAQIKDNPDLQARTDVALQARITEAIGGTASPAGQRAKETAAAAAQGTAATSTTFTVSSRDNGSIAIPHDNGRPPAGPTPRS